LVQHCAFDEQTLPVARQPAQSESAASAGPSQSLSAPSLHVAPGTSEAGGAPQSAAQLQAVSPASHVKSPQEGGAPQSSEQVAPVSPVPQEPSPQQNDAPGAVVHAFHDAVQRASPHPTGFVPAPSPQQ